MHPYHDPETPSARPIETASATTSPGNADSGPYAYLICAITLGALMLVGTLCWRAVASLAYQAIESGAISLEYDEGRGGHGTYLDDFYLDYYGYDLDFEDEQLERELMRLLDGSPR